MRDIDIAAIEASPTGEAKIIGAIEAARRKLVTALNGRNGRQEFADDPQNFVLMHYFSPLGKALEGRDIAMIAPELLQARHGSSQNIHDATLKALRAAAENDKLSLRERKLFAPYQEPAEKKQEKSTSYEEAVPTNDAETETEVPGQHVVAEMQRRNNMAAGATTAGFAALVAAPALFRVERNEKGKVTFGTVLRIGIGATLVGAAAVLAFGAAGRGPMGSGGRSV